MIAGVCAGLGQYSKLDPTVIRLIGVPLVFISGPGMILAYLVMALIIVDASALPAD
jgi:phage shock protein PspC (stress-responsive transcriptional regulator)